MNQRNVILAVALVGSIVGTAACGGGGSSPASGASASAPPIGAQDPPVTLRLGLADARGRQSEPVAFEFVERVYALSEGNITIEPTFNAGDGTNIGFETAVNEKVKRGDLEFGITAARSWDLTGVTSLRALQAPFLIDTGPLALEVAKSAVATKAMAGMTSVGVSGLALWPEDLRHLFAFPHCAKDFRTPEGIAGSTILVIPSQTSRDVVTSLGGIDYPRDERGEDADACLLHGMEAGLVGAGLPVNTAAATGNVVLFPKYQALVANTDALSRLTDSQRAIIHQAAAETQAYAYTKQPVEAEIAEAWCKSGGTVLVASEAQVAALVAAAAPVMTALERDPLTKQLIADIAAIKADIDAKPLSTPCGPPVAEQSTPPVDTTGFAATAIPDGVYRTDLTQADLLARGASARFASMNWGIKTWTFAGNSVSFDQGENGGPPCYGSYEVVKDRHLTFTTDRGGCGFDGDYLWREDGDGLAFVLVPRTDWSAQDVKDNAAMFEQRVWTKVD